EPDVNPTGTIPDSPSVPGPVGARANISDLDEEALIVALLTGPAEFAFRTGRLRRLTVFG
ncbi:MAG: hypothetical protein ABW214_02330, partial [Terrimicrobiaceae bacterium]